MPVIQLEYCQVCDTELCNDDPSQICKECADTQAQQVEEFEFNKRAGN